MPRTYTPLPLLHTVSDLSQRLKIGEDTYLVTREARELPEMISRLVGSRVVDELSGVRSWITTDLPSDNPSEAEQQVSFERVYRGVEAVQLISPVGVDPHLAWVDDFNGEPTLRTWVTRSNQQEPIWARLYLVSEQDLADLPLIWAGLEWAHRTKSRIRNSTAFLQHGLISRHPMIRALMFTVGLDSLLLAFTKRKFEQRLKRLFGATNPVFPPLGYLEMRPPLTVAQIAGDLYDLRNQLAHGQILEDRFLRHRPFEDSEGEPCFADQEYAYFEILCEAASALLCRALRKILQSEELRTQFATKREWQRRLSPSHE